jgi:hypothetical protein
MGLAQRDCPLQVQGRQLILARLKLPLADRHPDSCFHKRLILKPPTYFGRGPIQGFFHG